MAQYIVYPNSVTFPQGNTTYFVEADTLDGAINVAVSLYDLGGTFRVDKLDTDLHIYNVEVNVTEKKITTVDP